MQSESPVLQYALAQQSAATVQAVPCTGHWAHRLVVAQPSPAQQSVMLVQLPLTGAQASPTRTHATKNVNSASNIRLVCVYSTSGLNVCNQIRARELCECEFY